MQVTDHPGLGVQDADRPDRPSIAAVRGLEKVTGSEFLEPFDGNQTMDVVDVM